MLSVAALRTESDTTGGAESSARAPKLGAAVAMLNNSKDREEEEKDMKKKKNFVGLTIRDTWRTGHVWFSSSCAALHTQGGAGSTERRLYC